jgi:hypothetical protein
VREREQDLRREISIDFFAQVSLPPFLSLLPSPPLSFPLSLRRRWPCSGWSLSRSNQGYVRQIHNLAAVSPPWDIERERQRKK